MSQNDGSARAEIESLKAGMAEVEAELQWFKWLLVGTIGFMLCVVWHYS